MLLHIRTNILQPHSWTNIFFLIPTILSFSLNLPVVASLFILNATIMSTLYHLLTHEHSHKKLEVLDISKIFERLDVISAYFLIIINSILIFHDLSLETFDWLGLIFAVLAVILYSISHHHPNQNALHGWWHILSAMVTVCAVLAFAGY